MKRTVKKTYRAAPGARFGNKRAQVYGMALEDLKRRLGKAPSTDDIWRAAKPPSSPLHDFFDWDIRKAAVSWWRSQARNLVNHIEVVVIRCGTKERIRGFFNVEVPSTGQTVYEDADTVSRNPFLRRQIVEYALREAREWKRKYEVYRDFPRIRVILHAIEKVNSKRVPAVVV